MSAFGYNAEYFDAATGMIHLRARQYEPTMMRFNQEDIIRGSVSDPISLNRYLYCHNNPLSFSDPSGMTILSKLKSAAKSAVTAVKSTATAAAAKVVSSAAKVTATVAKTVNKAATAVSKAATTVSKAATKIASNSNSKIVKTVANAVANKADKVTTTANKVAATAKKVETVATKVAETCDKIAADSWEDAKKNFSSAAKDFNEAAKEAKQKVSCVTNAIGNIALPTLTTNPTISCPSILGGNLVSNLSCASKNNAPPKEGEPGYLYKTVDKAAIAAAYYIGPESFESGYEYSSTIYSVEVKTGNKTTETRKFLFFTYEVNTYETETMYTFTKKKTSHLETKVHFPLATNRVATVHTHPYHRDDYMLDYQRVSTDDKNYGNFRSIEMYVYRADGVLLKYIHDSDEIVKLRVELPIDPHIWEYALVIPKDSNMYPYEDVEEE